MFDWRDERREEGLHSNAGGALVITLDFQIYRLAVKQLEWCTTVTRLVAVVPMCCFADALAIVLTISGLLGWLGAVSFFPLQAVTWSLLGAVLLTVIIAINQRRDECVARF